MQLQVKLQKTADNNKQERNYRLTYLDVSQ